MEIWKKNLSALAERNKCLADKLEQIILQGDSSEVSIKVTDSGEKVLEIVKDGYIWGLNSRLDPKGAAAIYARRYKIKPFDRYFIFGFSDGLAVRNLLRQCDKSNVLLIYEPNANILAEAIKQYDLEEIFSDNRIWIGIPEIWEEMQQILATAIEYSYIKLLEFCILPGYDILYPELCEKYMEEIIDRKRIERIYKETYEKFNQKIPGNLLFHMKYMIKQRNFVQIKKEMQRLGISDIPAVIIAAGPSLDRNIQELKKAEGKAFIFVVDAALRTVIREGIKPHLVCTVDPNAPERFFETVDNHKFLWACSYWTNTYPVREYGEKVFYYDVEFPWWDGIIQKELNCELAGIENGGSVSSEAFELARYLGFKTIIFMGQDLAFTGGQSHTSGIKGVLGDNDAYINGRYVVQVEDVNGNMVDTDFQMQYYKEWFEKKIEKAGSEIRVIDATEGGAKIKGAVIQTLKETIAQECKREMNIFEILDNLPPVFDEAQQEYLYKQIKELDVLKEEFREYVKKEHELEQELKSNFSKYNKNQISDKLKNIMEQNEIIEQHPFRPLITLYTRKEEFQLKEDIYSKEDMDIPEIMERSIRLMESYQAAIPLFEEDYYEVIREEQKA